MGAIVLTLMLGSRVAFGDCCECVSTDPGTSGQKFCAPTASVGIQHCGVVENFDDVDCSGGTLMAGGTCVGGTMTGAPAGLNADCVGGVAVTIAFTKTVGLASNLCSTSEAITVSPGTSVTYCYTVQNTSNITSSMQMLVDRRCITPPGQSTQCTLVDLTSMIPPDGMNTELPPGQFISFQKTTIITAPAGSTITNTATCTSKYTVPGGTTTTTANDPGSALVIVSQKSVAPTVSSAGLVFISIALLLVGAVRLTRKRRENA